MLHPSQVLFRHRSRHTKNIWDVNLQSVSTYLIRQPYQPANKWNHPKHLCRLGYPKFPRTPPELRPDKDRRKYCDMSMLHAGDNGGVRSSVIGAAESRESRCGLRSTI